MHGWEIINTLLTLIKSFLKDAEESSTLLIVIGL